MKKENIVIFGASGGALKVAKTFNNLGIPFHCFVDNDSKKWGQYVEGKIVKCPEYIKNKDCRIVIASIYQEQIELQLKEMGIGLDRIVPKEKYIIEFLKNNIEKYSYLKNNDIILQEKYNYIVDLAEGMEIGGIETWSFELTHALNKYGENACIYTSDSSVDGPFNLKKYIKKIDITFDNYEQSLINIMNNMIKSMPFILISNWMTQNFMAAYILRNFYPNQVKIIGVVHHDMLGYYRRNKYLENYLDKYICVSCDTKKRMIEEFGVNPNMVNYKEVAIPYDTNYIKKFPDNSRPININFASRLVKAQKRADLIIPLIEKLEEKNVDYKINIAGDGKYFDIILEYINTNHLTDKVNLHGALKFSDMKEFWKTGDIVISLSDSEGMGLSILEGMSYGLVPVVTNTAGIKDFVSTNENGYVCCINDIEEISSNIRFLSINREYLNEYSHKARKVIFEKCSEKSYVDMLKSI